MLRSFWGKIKLRHVSGLAFLLILFLGIAFPLQTYAQPLGWLATRIATSLVALILQVAIFLSSVVLMLASWLLNWVTSPSFIGVKFTDNPFVTPAWTLVRDFTNMGFIMALVAIGVGTALRQGQYQIQKVLPSLVIIALAINFTPVICGLFIDISNIIMDFFLQGVNFDWAVRTWREMSIALSSTVTSEGFWEVMGAGIGMIAFNIIAGLVFFAFAFLLAARYVALWILVILSPLAFFCYILPTTKSIWNQWWSQLIAWCFVGAQAGFWIYLSYQMMTVSGQITGAPSPDPEFQGITAIVGYIIPVIFLSFGLVASVATTAQGSNMAIDAFNWTKGQVLSKGKSLGAAAALGTARKAREKMPAEWKEKIGQAALTPIWGAAQPGAAGILKRALARPVWTMSQRVLPKFTEEAERKEIDKMISDLEKSSVSEVLASLRKAGASRAKQIAALNALAKKVGGIEDAMKKGLTNKEIADVFIKAMDAGTEHYKDLIKALPDALGRAINPINPALAIEGVLGHIKPEEIAKMPLKELKTKESVKAIVQNWTDKHMEKIKDNEVIDKVIAEINDQFDTIVNDAMTAGRSWEDAMDEAFEKMAEKNMDLLKWRLTSIQAQASSGFMHDIRLDPRRMRPHTDKQISAIFKGVTPTRYKPPDFPTPP